MTQGSVPLNLAISGGAAFVGVFSVFVAAFVVLAVVTLRWAVRRDRRGRAEWLRRRSAAAAASATGFAQTNGHGPRHGERPQQRPTQPRGEANPRSRRGQGRGPAPEPRRGREPGGAR